MTLYDTCPVCGSEWDCPHGERRPLEGRRRLVTWALLVLAAVAVVLFGWVILVVFIVAFS